MTYTSQDAAASYSEIALKLAQTISQTREVKNRCEFISEKMNDNNDPGFELSEALEKLGIALSSAVIYADEYAKECAKESKTSTSEK